MAAVLAAVVGAVILLVAPLSFSVQVRTEVGDGSGAPEPIDTGATLIEADGRGVLGVLLVPVGLTAVGLVRRKDLRVMSAGLLWAFCFVSMFSLGLYFVPAAGLMTAAAVRAPRSPV